MFYSRALIKDDVIATRIPSFCNRVERTLGNDSKVFSSKPTSYWLRDHLACMLKDFVKQQVGEPLRGE